MRVKTCTFFGNRDAPESVKPLLQTVLQDLIEEQHVKKFYVGNEGRFDAMTQRLLKEFAHSHGIDYSVVLAYMPKKTDPFFESYYTLLPEGIEAVPLRFAIEYRNNWMIEHCDIVLTYVTSLHGGAAKFKAFAEKKGKTVIEISDFR